MQLKSYAATTKQGPYLNINEDGYDFDFQNSFYFLLDGFGGSGCGDKAIQRIKLDLKDFLFKLSDDPNATMPLYFNPRYLLEGNALINVLLHAHQRLFRENQELPLQHRAGASGVFALRGGEILNLCNIGNTQAYLFRQGHLEKIFSEDSLHLHSGEPIDKNELNVTLNGIGLYQELTFFMKEIRIISGDTILLMSDGLHHYLGEEEILYALTQTSSDLSSRLHTLVKLSNSRGNWDNQTGMILQF
jgi:serine/threonine protein phosphatase PrpC